MCILECSEITKFDDYCRIVCDIPGSSMAQADHRDRVASEGPPLLPPTNVSLIIDIITGRRVQVQHLRSFAEFKGLSVPQLVQIWHLNSPVGVGLNHPQLQHTSKWPSAEHTLVAKIQVHFNGWCLPESANLQSYAERSKSQKWPMESLFPSVSAGTDHKCMPLGYQWGPSSCPNPLRECDHPGCNDPQRKNVPMASFSCGHHYHSVCCERSNVREHPRPSDFGAPGLGCDKTQRFNDDIECVGLVCLICFEGIRVAAAIEGRKAKKLLETESEVAVDDDDDEQQPDEGPEDDPSDWSPERCQEEIDRAVCRIRNLSLLLPSH
jgi:hypothetical protein